MARPVASRSTPWRIHFFRRVRDGSVPALEFFETLSPKVAAEIHAVLDAVAAAPPPSFSGGGQWEAMHSDMAGYYEVRVQGDGKNHRLFRVLDRDGNDLGGSSLVCIDGLSKPRRTAAEPRDYRRVRRYGAEFGTSRTVL